MPDVTFQRKDFARYVKRAELVNDVCDNAVKEKGEKYLPRPNPDDKSKENKTRYNQFLLRSVFYNATGYTAKGLVGAAFTKVPELKRPDGIEFIDKDVDGSGLGIFQQGQSVMSAVLKTGRHGLFVDYPKTDGSQTKKEMEDNYIRASVVSISGTKIINWKTTKVGGKHLLSLIVYEDNQAVDTSDGFGVEVVEQYRVLKLVAGIYTVEIWRKNSTDKAASGWVLFDSFTPTNGSGKQWSVIPFIFVGAQNNDPVIDDGPLYDMGVINIAHYRNSADYEDSAYMVGQAQPWASGMTESYAKMLKEEDFYIGSRTLFPVPPDGEFGFAQVEPNMLCKEAMDSKEKQMIAIGARLVRPGEVVKTATEAQNDNETEHSVLSLIASNVSDAYVVALGWVAEFMSATGDIIFSIQQDYSKMGLDAQLITAINGLFQSGRYPETQFFAVLRKMGAIDPELTDEEIKEELLSNPPGLNLDADE